MPSEEEIRASLEEEIRASLEEERRVPSEEERCVPSEEERRAPSEEERRAPPEVRGWAQLPRGMQEEYRGLLEVCRAEQVEADRTHLLGN